MGVSRNSSEFSTRVAAALALLLPRDVPLWVGLSGGRDSVALLHVARQLLPGRVCALHVHHGLSPHADDWADFCAALCRDWEIPHVLRRIKVARDDGQGLEAAARSGRYHAFQELGVAWLALAHHRRDQAETLLFNLCRGAGVIGAAAMLPLRKSGDLTLLRPLLGVDAKAIAAYAKAERLCWVEDESNADTRYSRNFLRCRVLPELATRFPALEATLSRAAGHFAEAQELLDDLAAEDDARIAGRLAPLLEHSPARQANWLRYWLRRQGWHAPEHAALAETLRQLAALAGKPDHHFELNCPEGALRLWQGRLYCARRFPPPLERAWDGKTPCPWAGGWLRLEPCLGAGLSAALVAGKTFCLRVRQGGEEIVAHAGSPRRALKKLLQENRIPPWERDRLPLVYLDNELIACPGVAIAAPWQCQSNQPGMSIVYDYGQ
jgi:tRNA(Ile)-lysidine synthase